MGSTQPSPPAYRKVEEVADKALFWTYILLVPPLTLVLEIVAHPLASLPLFLAAWVAIWAYGGLLFFFPPRRYPLLLLAIDGIAVLLLLLLLTQTGAADSPFQVLFVMIAFSAIALRPWQAILLAGTLIAGDLAQSSLFHHRPDFDPQAILSTPILAVLPVSLSVLFTSLVRLDRSAEEERSRSQFRETYKALLAGHDMPAIARQATLSIEGVMKAALAVLWVPAPDGSFRVEAAEGRAIAYLQETHTSQVENTPLGQGPAGKAYRERRAIVVNDIEEDPIFIPWREAARKNALRSTFSHPIQHGDRVYGVFSVYFEKKDAFTPERLDLLTDYAEMMGLAFFKASLLEEVQEKAEALQSANEYIQSVFAAVGEGLCALDREGKVIMINPSGAAMLGYTPEELQGKNLHALTHHHRPDGSPLPAEECPVQTVLQTGLPYRGAPEDYLLRRDGRFFPVSRMANPILLHGQRAGVIVAFQDETERRTALQEIRRVNDRLHELVACARDLNQAADEEEAVRILQEYLGRVEGIAGIHFYPLSAGGSQDGSAEIPPCAAEMRLAATESSLPFTTLARQGSPSDRSCREMCHAPDGGSIYCQLLGHPGDGVYEAALSSTSPNFFTGETLERVRSMLQFGSLVVGNLRTMAENRRLSLTDALTGLYNRRFFEEILPRVASLSRQSAHPFTLLMLDVDHFKIFNDTYGHEAGDQVLETIAALMASFCRKTDYAIRLGGEEFLLLLEDTPLKEGQAVADRLREQIAGTSILLPQPVQVTVSIGVCTYRGGEEGQVLESADRMLYMAKEQGRNRVVACPDPD